MDRTSWLAGLHLTLGFVFLSCVSLSLTQGCNSGNLGRSSAPSATSADQEDVGQDAPTSDGSGDSQPNTDVIKLQFINRSDVAVDTQFFATNEVLADPGNDLFSEQFRVRSAIGVAGSGLLPSGDTDELTFPCSESTSMGTLGGEFLDPDLGTLLANGQVRMLEVGANFDCGNTIVFTYQGQDGEYSTAPPVPIFEVR